jgi:hypothetical protein
MSRRAASAKTFLVESNNACLVTVANAINDLFSEFLLVPSFKCLFSCNVSGKAVLNQKSELQRALQKQREVQSRKEVEKERLSTRSALEITLAKRAQRLEEVFIQFRFLKMALFFLYERMKFLSWFGLSFERTK